MGLFGFSKQNITASRKINDTLLEYCRKFHVKEKGTAGALQRAEVYLYLFFFADMISLGKMPKLFRSVSYSHAATVLKDTCSNVNLNLEVKESEDIVWNRLDSYIAIGKSADNLKEGADQYLVQLLLDCISNHYPSSRKFDSRTNSFGAIHLEAIDTYEVNIALDEFSASFFSDFYASIERIAEEFK